MCTLSYNKQRWLTLKRDQWRKKVQGIFHCPAHQNQQGIDWRKWTKIHLQKQLCKKQNTYNPTPNYHPLKYNKVRDCQQITFVTHNGFCLLVKQPHPLLLLLMQMDKIKLGGITTKLKWKIHTPFTVFEVLKVLLLIIWVLLHFCTPLFIDDSGAEFHTD